MSNENQQKIQKATEVILEAMGINLNSPDFKETPKRFAKAMMEFRIKSDDEKPTITTFDTGGDRDGFVKVTGLEVRSLCGHHLFPFFGSAIVGYVPSDRKAGLSKFQRVLDFVANKPQDQEGLTEEYLNLLVKELDPQMLVVKVVCQHTCFSDDTEVLTEDGFKLLKEVCDDLYSGKVATYRINSREIEFQPILNYISYPYLGKMIEFGDSNQKVTPNHRILYRTDWEARSDKNFKIDFSQDCYKIPTIQIPRAGNFNITTHSPIFYDRNYDEELFAELLGIYLAEGSYSLNNRLKYYCRISQNINSPLYFRIKFILNKLGIEYTEQKSFRKNINFTITKDKELIKFFKSLGKSDNKYIPKEYKFTTQNIRKAVIDGFFAGDGCYVRNNRYYTTKSFQLASDIQEILSLSNISCVLRKRGNANCYDVMENVSKSGRSKFFKTEHKNNNIETDYSGMVYCLNVENTTLVLRRNGRVFISGNCMIARGVKCHSSETTTIVNYVKSTVEEDKRKIFNTYLQNL